MQARIMVAAQMPLKDDEDQAQIQLMICGTTDEIAPIVRALMYKPLTAVFVEGYRLILEPVAEPSAR